MDNGTKSSQDQLTRHGLMTVSNNNAEMPMRKADTPSMPTSLKRCFAYEDPTHSETNEPNKASNGKTEVIWPQRSMTQPAPISP
jgi:hypothetical protein